MFRPLNEFKYTAKTGKIFVIYFLKFWPARDEKNDYIVKYQIRASDKDFVWYGRISKERYMSDVKVPTNDIKSISKQALEERIQNHLKKLFIYVIKKGLDKGFEEANTEFVFYKKPPILKRAWNE